MEAAKVGRAGRRRYLPGRKHRQLIYLVQRRLQLQRLSLGLEMRHKCTYGFARVVLHVLVASPLHKLVRVVADFFIQKPNEMFELFQ